MKIPYELQPHCIGCHKSYPKTPEELQNWTYTLIQKFKITGTMAHKMGEKVKYFCPECSK